MEPAVRTAKQELSEAGLAVRRRFSIPETKSRKLVVDTPTKGMPMRDTWDISVLAAASKERCGYPTQKPLKLLERIIRASTNEGDFVFDPFCGCATTLVAAEKLSRNWGGGRSI